MTSTEPAEAPAVSTLSYSRRLNWLHVLWPSPISSFTWVAVAEILLAAIGCVLPWFSDGLAVGRGIASGPVVAALSLLLASLLLTLVGMLFRKFFALSMLLMTVSGAMAFLLALIFAIRVSAIDYGLYVVGAGAYLVMVGGASGSILSLLLYSREARSIGLRRCGPLWLGIIGGLALAGMFNIPALPQITFTRFIKPTRAAMTSSLSSTLQTLRSQIMLYKLQHGDTLPDITKDWTPLTTQTTYGSTTYGPYMQSIPVNPINSMSGVIDGIGGAPSSAPCGFIYDYNNGNGTGRIFGTDEDGKTVFIE